MSLDPDDKLTEALGRMPREMTPPPGLQNATVAALYNAGVLRRPHARPAVTWILAAGLAVVAFGAGMYIPRPGATPAAPTFALLLYGGGSGNDSAAHATRAAEYTAWAASPQALGTVLGGEALSSGGIAIFKPDTGLFGGIAANVIDDDDPNELVGYFLVNAPDRQSALRMARDCPHLKYGGRVVVRTILPT